MMASIQTVLHSLLRREPVEVAAVVSDLNRTLFGCLAAALCTHADAWTAGAEQYDDMTLVGLRVRG